MLGISTSIVRASISRVLAWACFCCCVPVLGGCINLGSLAAGKMDWVQPQSEGPRAGNVYLVRGWVGVFSHGMDELGGKINQHQVTSHVFQHDQCKELAATMVARYKESRNPEPIVMIGHSFGSDDALFIARELDKAGVPVDLIITLDAVNETVVPKNVKLCYNYWQPGVFGSTNFLRGIPLTQEPGGTGKLVNVNLLVEGRDLREPNTNHINIGEAPKLHQAIIQHVLSICPERATWVAMHPASATSAVAASKIAPVESARPASVSFGAQATPGEKTGGK